MTWTPEKAQLFSSANTLVAAWDTRDPDLIGPAEWFRDRARRAWLRSLDAPQYAKSGGGGS